MEYAIETFSLTKVFSDWRGQNKVYAVDNLNLKIRYNEVFGLLGPNGSGKTTTLKMLLGLLYPTKGKYLVLGGDSTNPKISSKIGFMPEESYLYKYLSARETLDFYGRLFSLPARIRKNRTENLLEMVGLKAVANRAVGTFSKGMARRIGLAQALINDPELLVLDEPTTGLDPIGTRQIKDLIIELGKRGKTILLCSHLLADVEDVCDRIAILYGGRIQTQGQVRDLLQQTDKKQITTSYISHNTIQKIKTLVKEDRADFQISTPMEKLETFFIKTVADAQAQGQSTSGSVSDSSKKIEDFLSDQPQKEKILDKLVSAPLLQQDQQPSSASEKITTTKPVRMQPDQSLLGKLTRRQPLPKPKTPVKTKTPVTKNTEQKNKKTILDQLTGESGTTKIDKGKKQKENQSGDPGDE